MSQPYLYLVVFVAGAAVLAIEILGTRILGPFYGVSLFLWSALITVTLIALSLGYAVGGRWADRRPALPRLYAVLAAAGLWTLAIPWLRDPILVVAEPFGLRFAVLVAAFTLFVVPLTLLGMVSPFAIRIRASSLQVVGTTAGDLYAVSTLGSVVAALLTGFVLIPNVGVTRLTLLTGGLLVATAVLGLALGVRSGARRAIALLALPLAGVAGWHLPTGGAGDVPGLIALAQSPYAEIRVLDTPDGQRRLLVIDGGTHTIVTPSTWESQFPYVAVMGLTRCLVAEPGRMLLVGLGGGSLVKDFAADGWEVDAVEIDPVVVEMAKAHFGLTDAEGSIQVADGRQFLIAHTGKYDVIAMDAFGSSSIPFHLVTREVFALIASRLAPGGVLAINLESHGWDGPVVKAIAASLKPHFREVLALPAHPDRDKLGNVVLLAANTPLALRPDTEGRRKDRYDCEAYYWNPGANLGWNQRFVPDTSGVAALTDDLNPVDVWAEHTNFLARQDLHRYFGEQGLKSY